MIGTGSDISTSCRENSKPQYRGSEEIGLAVACAAPLDHSSKPYKFAKMGSGKPVGFGEAISQIRDYAPYFSSLPA